MGDNLKNKKAQFKKKIDELDDILLNKKRLSRNEYLDALYEIQKNYCVMLLKLSLEMETDGTGACAGVLDKVHWIIDSMEPYAKSTDIIEDYGMDFKTPAYDASLNN